MCSVAQQKPISSVYKFTKKKCLRIVLNEGRYAKIQEMHELTNMLMIKDHIKEIVEHFYDYLLANNLHSKDLAKLGNI